MKFVKSRCRGKSFDVAGKRANSWHCPCSEWEGERAVVLIWWGGERVVYRLGDGCCEVRTQRNCESAYRTVPCQFVHNGTVNVRTERYVWQCVQNGIVLVRKERYCESAYRTVLWKGVQNGTLKVHREQYCESAYRTVLWKCVQNGTVKMRTERYCESAFRTVLVTVRTERYLWQCVQSVTVQVRTERYCESAYRTVLWTSLCYKQEAHNDVHNGPAELCHGTTSHRHPTDPAGTFRNWVSISLYFRIWQGKQSPFSSLITTSIKQLLDTLVATL